MKTLQKSINVTFFSILAMALVHCGPVGQSGTIGSSFVEDRDKTEENFPVPSVSATREFGNDIILDITIDSDASFSHFEIERKDGEDQPFQYVDEAEDTTYVDLGLAPGLYIYRVRAVYQQIGYLSFSKFSDEERYRMPR